MSASPPTREAVAILTVPAGLAAVVRRRIPLAEIPEAQRLARGILAAALARAGVEPEGPNLTVWRMPADGSIDYAPGVFVPADTHVSGEVSLFRLPEGRAAHLRLSGAYDGLPAAWAQLFASASGHALAGLNWEVYTAAGPAPADTHTDLYALLA